MQAALERAVRHGESGTAEIAQIETALRGAGVVVYVWNRRTGQTTWSPNATQVLELDMAGQEDFWRRLPPDVARARAALLDNALAKGTPFALEYKLTRGRAKPCWVEDRGLVIADPHGEIGQIVGALSVITARKQREGRLAYLACYDDLTGLLNRARFYDSLSRTVATCRRTGRSAACLLVGLDHLDRINRTYGFDAADEVIIAISGHLEACLPQSAVIGRVGGDRFGVVLPDCDENQARTIVAEALESLRDHVIDTHAGPVAASLSIGCVMLPREARTSKMAMARAGEALERARTAGREGVAVYRFSAEEEAARRRHLDLAEEIVAALRERRIALAYQPILRAESGEVEMHEALLRLVRPSGEVVAAGEFIPTAERLGLIRHLDQAAFTAALEVLRAHPAARLAVNVSALTVTDPGWIEDKLTALETEPELASRLTVEVTETAAILDLPECARFLGRLKALGCRLALDDFGAGYTSFRHLKTLPFDTVKIDGSFIRGLLENRDNQVFVRTLIELARNLGLDIVAECVGGPGEAALLRDWGVHYFQGFYFGRPDLALPW